MHYGCKNINLWLEYAKHEALQSVLEKQGTTVEHAAQKMLEDYYNEIVSPAKRAKISEDLESERNSEIQRAEARRRFTLYHICEEGKEHWFESTTLRNECTVAFTLRNYLRDGQKNGLFFNNCLIDREIDVSAFEQRLSAHLTGDTRVYAVVSVDLDAGIFSYLHQGNGWRRYSVQDAVTAAYHAFRNQHNTIVKQQNIFYDKLRGKELAPDIKQEQDDPGLQIG